MTTRTRNANAFHRLPRARRSHGLHFFCAECFNRVWLGSVAFKLYLLVAWCIGLTALMCLQKGNGMRGIAVTSAPDDITNLLLSGVFLTYLLAQIFGLLACVTELEQLFAPYVIVLTVVIIANITSVGYALVGFINQLLFSEGPKGQMFGVGLGYVLILGVFFLLYNSLCLASVLSLCAKFDKKRLIAERRQREVIAHNTRIYERLVALQAQEATAVTVNVDSPPKYSSLDKLESGSTDTPPPGYSQLQRIEDEEDVGEGEKKRSFRRALFKDPPV